MTARTRPARRLKRVDRTFLCEVAADGVSIEGQTVDLNEQGMAIALAEPLFARPDSATLTLIRTDGSLARMNGRVIRQQSMPDGRVLAAIRLTELPVETTSVLIEKCAPASPFEKEPVRIRTLTLTGVLRRFRRWVTSPAMPSPDRRQIPRLSIHTTCTILGREPYRKGLTEDVSYTGFSALFPDFRPDLLWGALFQIKFVTLKAIPVGITYWGTTALVRFRVDRVIEGQERWRELHYSCWRHLS